VVVVVVVVVGPSFTITYTSITLNDDD